MRITEALANSRNKRIQAETDAIAPQATNLQGTVQESTQNGLKIRTQNDGVITVAAPTGANASVGQTIQATASGGAIQAGLPVQSVARAGDTADRVPQIRYKLRAPVVGQDFGLPGDMWVHEHPDQIVGGFVQGNLFMRSPVQGGFMQVSGGGAAVPVLFGVGKPSFFTFGSIAEGDDYDAPVQGQVFINTRFGINRPYRYVGTTWASQRVMSFNASEGIPYRIDLEPNDIIYYQNADGCWFTAFNQGSGMASDWQPLNYEIDPGCTTQEPEPPGGPWVGDCKNYGMSELCS